MQFLQNSNKSKGVEVLFFEDAEIEKYKGDTNSFGASGDLFVLYFKDYNRFVLQLNDWKYPLIRRLPIVLTSDITNVSHRTYVFPGKNGFSFQLKLHKIANLQSLINFETILSHNTIFSTKGEDTSMRKLELSPDDKLVRHHNKDTGAKEIITGNVMSVFHTIKNKVQTMKSGTKYLTSTKKRINLKDLKNKDFKKTATKTVKKGFRRSGDVATYEFLEKRRQNKNLFEAKEFSLLSKTSDTPIHYINREDIEESILRNKELAISGHYAPLEKLEKKTTLVDSLKSNISSFVQKVTDKKDELISGNRDTATTLKEEKFTQLESLHHSEA